MLAIFALYVKSYNFALESKSKLWAVYKIWAWSLNYKNDTEATNLWRPIKKVNVIGKYWKTRVSFLVFYHVVLSEYGYFDMT